MRRRGNVTPVVRRRLLAIVCVAVAIAVVLAWQQIPTAAAYALLRPARHVSTEDPPSGCDAASFTGVDVTLKGWRCLAAPDPHATIVLLHGIADNRASWRGAIPRFTQQHFDVVVFDGRAHGESGGDWCTYGFHEKEDLRRVLDGLSLRPIVLLGTSLGAAIALQAAANDARVAAVVAAETFSDLRTVAVERAPFFLTPGMIRRAFGIAEHLAAFSVDDVSPLSEAAKVTVPVLLIHGAADSETRPEHSRRVYDALAGPKRLAIVPGAGHNQSLGGPGVWDTIDRWIADALARYVASESGPNRPAK